MKTQSKQQRLDLDEFINKTVEQLPFGIPFRFTVRLKNQSPDIHIRVKPVNYLLNSSLVCDVISRHKCFVVNLNKGTLYIVEGDRFVDEVKAAIQEY